jgi:hypothetical protein
MQLVSSPYDAYNVSHSIARTYELAASMSSAEQDSNLRQTEQMC